MSIRNRLAQLKQKKKEIVENKTKKMSFSQDFLLEANRIVMCVKNKINDIPDWFSLDGEIQVDIIKNFISEEVKDDKFLGINLDGLISKILSQVNGYGILDNIINEELIKKIFVAGTNYISVQKNNEITKIPLKFDSEHELLGTAKRILSLASVEYDENIAFYEGELENKFLFNMVFPPVSKDGISITIERINDEVVDLEHLVQANFLSFEMSKFLVEAVKNSKNILIAGKTGVGKKTLLKALINEMDNSQRVFCLEDYKTHFSNFENLISFDYSDIIEDKKALSLLFKNLLSQKPDGVICPECEENLAYEFLKLINNGVNGLITTLYATSKTDALERFLGKLLLSSNGISVDILKRRIVSSFDYVVYVSDNKISKNVEVGEVVSVNDVGFVLKEVLVEKTLQKKAVTSRKTTVKTTSKK